MFFKISNKKNDSANKLTLPPCALSVWSPSGENTAHLSWELSKGCSKHTGTFLAELPCLSIPKLGFAADIMDRDKNMDNFIIEFDKKNEVSFKFAHRINDDLAVLPANVYAAPDFPVANRVEQETLIQVPVRIINMARKNGYPIIIFECQGQITTPMTFFALQYSDYILIPVKEPAEIALALLNIKRLVSAFKYSIKKFMIVSLQRESLEDHLVINDDEGNNIGKVDTLEHNIDSIIGRLATSVKVSESKDHQISAVGLKKLGAHGGWEDDPKDEEWIIRL